MKVTNLANPQHLVTARIVTVAALKSLDFLRGAGSAVSVRITTFKVDSNATDARSRGRRATNPVSPNIF